MKLQVDPAVNAHGHDLLHVPGTWAEGQAIQGVHCALLFARSRLDGLGFFPGE
jgi:hypothetical protein